MRSLRVDQFLKVVLASFLALVYLSCVAHAHAQFKDSQPPAGAVLDTAPEQLQLRFSEAIELRFSSVVFYNDQNQAQSPATLSADAQDPTRLIITPPPLSQGTYTVAWKAASAVDGHVIKGAFPLSVGVVSDAPVVETNQPGGLIWGRVVVRWLGFFGLFVWLGSVVFFKYVVRSTQPAAHKRWETLVRWGIGAVALAELLDFVYQVALFEGVSWATALAPTHWMPLLEVRYGQLAVVRLGAGVGALGLTWIRPAHWRTWGVFLLGTTVVVLRSLSGHNAALDTQPVWAILADIVHMLALSAWVGGLATMLWLRPVYNTCPARAQWFTRFSRLALISVSFVVLSGTYMAYRHLPQWNTLWLDAYGQAILAKAFLLVGVLALATANLLKHVPALKRQATQRVFQRLQQTVGAEVVLTGIILVFGTLLTLMAPAVSDERPMPPQFVEAQTLDFEGQALTLALHVIPAQIGPGQIQVRLTDAAQNAIAAQRIRLTLTYLDQDLGDNRVVLSPTGYGLYGASGTFFSLPGNWQVAVEARFQGKPKDLRASFQLRILGTKQNGKEFE